MTEDFTEQDHFIKKLVTDINKRIIDEYPDESDTLYMVMRVASMLATTRIHATCFGTKAENRKSAMNIFLSMIEEDHESYESISPRIKETILEMSHKIIADLK